MQKRPAEEPTRRAPKTYEHNSVLVCVCVGEGVIQDALRLIPASRQRPRHVHSWGALVVVRRRSSIVRAKHAKETGTPNREKSVNVGHFFLIAHTKKNRVEFNDLLFLSFCFGDRTWAHYQVMTPSMQSCVIVAGIPNKISKPVTGVCCSHMVC